MAEEAIAEDPRSVLGLCAVADRLYGGKVARVPFGDVEGGKGALGDEQPFLHSKSGAAGKLFSRIASKLLHFRLQSTLLTEVHAGITQHESNLIAAAYSI